MDLENERLKMKCETCQSNFILTLHTVKCPKCGATFNPDEVHQFFYNYESRLANSKLYQHSQRLQKSGQRTEKAGETISDLGCLFILLPIAILGLIFAVSLLK